VSGGAADASLEQQLTLGLTQAAPDAVGLTDRQRVSATLGDHWASTAHLLSAQLTLGTGAAALAVRMEKHRRIDAPAQT
jgi:hypothetical protein